VGSVLMRTVRKRQVLGVAVDAICTDAASEAVSWSQGKQFCYVCFASVNNIMEAHDSPGFRRIMNDADLVAPDGMALVWALRLLGVRNAARVYGPDTTLVLLDAATREGIPVGLYGASPTTLTRLLDVVRRRFPALDVVYAWSPPFRPLTPDEDEEVVRNINESGARILFIGISTPKQEYWMAAHRGRVRAVMLGVGAAFDFIAGTKPQAPRWMMQIGLEWFFRLCTEPRRLWRRYLIHNPRFVYLFTLQLLGWRKFSADNPTRPSLGSREEQSVQ
jgi:N-acetylglucosaminyldiphosphoundecaprenol N-acetyl-beta-D-mannosaminyltransferase